MGESNLVHASPVCFCMANHYDGVQGRMEMIKPPTADLEDGGFVPVAMVVEGVAGLADVPLLRRPLSEV